MELPDRTTQSDQIDIQRHYNIMITSLLEGHKSPVDKRHVATTRVLFTRLINWAFSEPI